MNRCAHPVTTRRLSGCDAGEPVRQGMGRVDLDRGSGLVVAACRPGRPGGPPLRIPRDATREGQQDGDAIAAYDRTADWPVFAFGRNLVLRPLTRIRPHGLLIDVGCGPGQLTVKIGHNFPDLEVDRCGHQPRHNGHGTAHLAGIGRRRTGLHHGDGAASRMAGNSVDTSSVRFPTPLACPPGGR